MSEQDNYRRLGELAKQHLKLNGTSRRQFVMKNELNDGTVASFFNGQRIPTDANLKAITEGLGWDWKQVRVALSEADPEAIDLANLQADPWAGDGEHVENVSELSDESLLVELTRRLAEKNATIRQLRGQLERANSTGSEDPSLPTNVYDLAADQDRSGHGRAIHHELEEAGEESQDH